MNTNPSSKPAPNQNVRDVESARLEARTLPKPLRRCLSLLMLVTALYHMLAAGNLWSLPGIQHVAVHLGLGTAIIFLLFPASNKLRDSKLCLGLDLAVVVFSFVNMVYVAHSYETLAQRVGLPCTVIELIFGGLAILLLFEAARRTMGLAFPIVVACFVLYMFFGNYLPAPWGHSGIRYERFIQMFYLQMGGIYGSITRVSANVVLVFVLFSSIIKYSQIGDFIMDIAMAAVGGVRGGPAKVAVVSSGLMGMLSGNSTANVAGTGSFTIPLMKRTGYPGHFAGGVEAVASSGGQIMPPVMGASVFLMMEMTETPYRTIMAIALPVAIFYYAGLLISVDLTAVRYHLVGVPASERPNMKETWKNGWYLITPILVLTGLLLYGKTPQLSAFWAILTAIAVSFICPRNRMTLPRLLEAFEGGIKDCCMMFAICGLASLIQGIVQVSGIGVRLSGILVSIANGNLLVLLASTAGVCIILGMGMPVVVCYSFLALLIAPALVELGVPLLVAHMFVFYFGCMSCITPPVATAALVASGIAKAPFFQTAVEACKLAFSIFFIPFFFVYTPDFLAANGVTAGTVTAYLSIALSVYAAASGFCGCAWKSIHYERQIWVRICMVAAAITILVPIPTTELLGSAAVILLQMYLVIKHRREPLNGE